MNEIVTERKVCEEKVSSVNGTDDREAHSKFWIAALVQMNCEKKTVAKLNRLGYETYLPVQKEIRQWSDRQKIIDRIVIPMVVFIRVAPKEDEIIRNYSFIHKLLSLPGTKQIASPIPDIQIEQLRFLLSKAEDKVFIVSNLQIGDTITITKGVLRGFKGQLCIIEDNRPMVAIRIDGLGYACVKIAKTDII